MLYKKHAVITQAKKMLYGPVPSFYNAKSYYASHSKLLRMKVDLKYFAGVVSIAYGLGLSSFCLYILFCYKDKWKWFSNLHELYF